MSRQFVTDGVSNVVPLMYLSPVQAHRISGIHPDTIRKALRRGELRGYKSGVGKTCRWRIRRKDFDDWIQKEALR